MANPQAENGHIDIANEIYDALAKFSIPSEARRVLDFIIRKTWGWHKKTDRISLTQFEQGTGLRRSHVCRAITKLVEMNLIIKDSPRTGTTQSPDWDYHITTYGFQKDFDKWVGSPNTGTSPRTGTKGSPRIGNRVVPARGPTKETIQKKTNKRNIRTLSDEDWLTQIKANPAYKDIDIVLEINKCRAYFLPVEPSRRRILNWLNNATKRDKPFKAQINTKPVELLKENIPIWMTQAIKEGWKV